MFNKTTIWKSNEINYIFFQTEGKNDAHSGSESSASEELSQHSTSMVTLANGKDILQGISNKNF